MLEHLSEPLSALEDIKKQKLQLLVTIVEWNRHKKVTDILIEKHVPLQYICMGQGTASSELMDLLGLGSTDKAVVLCVDPEPKMPALLNALKCGLGLAKPGNGIALTVPLSGVSGAVFQMLDMDPQNSKLEKGVEIMSKDTCHDLVVAAINHGFSEELMDAARLAGATGGTVLHARRIGQEEAIKFLGIPIQAEKEIVFIVVNRGEKADIMKAISKACGPKTEAHGIVFSLPVDNIVGLSAQSGQE